MTPGSAEDQAPGAAAEPERVELSEREREILILVATGASNKTIAQQLVISPNTVKVHLRNIFAKVGVASRTEAALYAIREGLVQVSGDAPALAETAAAEDEGKGAPSAAASTAEVPLPPGSPALPAQAVPAGMPDQAAVPAAGPAEMPAVPARARPTWARWAMGLAGVAALLLIGALLALQPWRGNPASASAVPPTPPPRWRTEIELPTARAGLAVATIENQIYAIGGEGAEGVTGSVERFDTGTAAWTALASKPLAVADVGAAAIGGLIYVPGGRLPSGAVSDQLDVYDPAEDRWESRAEMPVALSGYALAAFEGQVYLFGGWDGQAYTDHALAYDPGRDEWRELPPMPTARGFAGAAAAGGLIYVVGGRNGEQALAVNEVYLPTRGAGTAWETRAPLPAPQAEGAAASLADSVYAVGGTQAEDQWGAWFYQPALDRWQALERPETPATSRLGLAVIQTRLHTLGGEQVEGPSGQHLSYQAIYTTIFPGVTGE
jgi:DNA-binding CsgD family transcriptional regulator/N-acetylneuraminic acid mutarotase